MNFASNTDESAHFEEDHLGEDAPEPPIIPPLIQKLFRWFAEFFRHMPSF